LTLAAHHAGDPPTQQSHTPSPIRLDIDVLRGPSEDVARRLLGVLIVRDEQGDRRVARIVETEAYAGPEDRASHARAGRTTRTAVMFERPGVAYVYLIYGLHHCLNVVCAPEGDASAVLVRAVEPVAGVAIMRDRRGPAAGPDHRLGAGPARACQALDIDRRLDGVDLLTDDRLWLAAPTSEPSDIAIGPRVGVDYAGPDWASRPWRFGIAGSAALSRPFPVLG
jgi:DNA-3-methyladenine glycosylase